MSKLILLLFINSRSFFNTMPTSNCPCYHLNRVGSLLCFLSAKTGSIQMPCSAVLILVRTIRKSSIINNFQNHRINEIEELFQSLLGEYLPSRTNGMLTGMSNKENMKINPLLYAYYLKVLQIGKIKHP